MGVELPEVVAARKRHGRGERLKQHAAERVDVGASINSLSASLLRGNVVNRAHKDPRLGHRDTGGRLRATSEAEVGQVDVFPLADCGDQDVGWLHVPMYETLAMGCVQCLRNLIDDPRGSCWLEPSLLGDHVAQVGPVYEAHREVKRAVLVSRGVHRDDVWMLQLGSDPRFPPEAVSELRIVGQLRRDHLQRDSPLGVVLSR